MTFQIACPKAAIGKSGTTGLPTKQALSGAQQPFGLRSWSTA
jgi:hypothetical protein